MTKIDELKRENKLLRREVERLQARIEVSRLKELKLLSDLIELQQNPHPPYNRADSWA
jgi:hypothetical protein